MDDGTGGFWPVRSAMPSIPRRLFRGLPARQRRYFLDLGGFFGFGGSSTGLAGLAGSPVSSGWG
jgi:hypothetical protein